LSSATSLTTPSSAFADFRSSGMASLSILRQAERVSASESARPPKREATGLRRAWLARAHSSNPESPDASACARF
jgi:hypothetical protein